jgi:SAM-dependent methyltransferase
MITLQNTLHTRVDFETYYANRDWRDYKWLLAYCVQFGQPGKILDLGAGLGYFVECCQKFGLKCTGIEGSEFAIKEAGNRGVLLTHLIMKESTVLPFEEGEFGVVVCNQTAHHLLPKVAKRVFIESFRVLKNEGVFIAFEGSVYNKDERKHPSHINLFTPSRLKSEIEDAGFIILSEPNAFKGGNIISRNLRRILFTVFRIESLLNTANAIAQKPPKASSNTI